MMVIRTNLPESFWKSVVLITFWLPFFTHPLNSLKPETHDDQLYKNLTEMMYFHIFRFGIECKWYEMRKQLFPLQL